jgi:hypothetical protein
MVMIFLIDLVMPDVVPVIDELYLSIVFLQRVKKILWVQKFIEQHKILTVLLLIFLLVAVITSIRWLFGVIG